MGAHTVEDIAEGAARLAVDAPEPGPQAVATSNAARLRELVADDADLRLWLQHTRFFDAAHRERVLDGLRKLRAVEEERDRLLVELRGSAGGLLHLPPPAAAASHDVPQAAPQSPASDVPSAVAEASKPSQSPSYFASPSTSVTDSVHGGSSALGEERPAPAPPPAAAGPTKDTRFFVVKCSNTANIYLSQRDGLWVTQAKNGLLLSEAFAQCQSVILFFSINKSRAFQGFARMTSAPDASIPKPGWIQKVNLTATTEPFRVEWINTVTTDFEDVGDLRNPLNENRSVVVGRDGQEYSTECGRRMMALMTQAAQKPPAAFSRLRARPDRLGFGSPDTVRADRATRLWRRRDADVPQPPPALEASLPPSPSRSVNLIDY